MSILKIARLGHPVLQKKASVVKKLPDPTIQKLIKDMAKEGISAVFHAAAVSDFAPVQVLNGKIDSNTPFTLKLKPTKKIINDLRNMYPNSLLIGWKYEIEGNHRSLLLKGQEQIERCGTDGCVLNGPAYGKGFGLLQDEIRHCDDEDVLFSNLITFGNTSIQGYLELRKVLLELIYPGIV